VHVIVCHASILLRQMVCVHARVSHHLMNLLLVCLRLSYLEKVVQGYILNFLRGPRLD
jgi:hypothetical protein